MMYPKTGYIRFFRGEYIHVILTPVFARIPISVIQTLGVCIFLAGPDHHISNCNTIVQLLVII